jgi:hypothetical protein
VGRLRSSGLIALLVLACVAVPAVAVGAQSPLDVSSPAAPAANSVTFNDSTGEDPAAPDITTLVVANDDAGLVSFRVNVPNRPSLGQDMLVDLYVDSDNNTATGAPDLAGVDYVMQLVQGEIFLYKWDGTDFTRRFGDPSAVTLSFAYQGGVTIRISAAELGNTKQFRFFVVVLSGLTVDPTTGALDFTNAKGDAAPGGTAGLYPFEVKVGRATLVVRKFSTAPRRPASGKQFALRLQVARSDTGAIVQGGRVTCVGRIGKARLRGTGRFVGRQAVCTFAIPATAKGKTFRGSITIVFEGLRSTRSFSGRVG